MFFLSDLESGSEISQKSKMLNFKFYVKKDETCTEICEKF